MRLLSIFCGIVCVFGVECIDWNDEFLRDNPVRQLQQRVLMGEVPKSDEEVDKYVEIYKADINDSVGLQSGILAAQYFIGKKRLGDAADLLSSIVPTVSSLRIDSDFRKYFARRIDCAGRLLSKYAQKKSIGSKTVESILSKRVGSRIKKKSSSPA